jgi:hypothetical protein
MDFLKKQNNRTTIGTKRTYGTRFYRYNFKSTTKCSYRNINPLRIYISTLIDGFDYNLIPFQFKYFSEKIAH